MDAANVAWNNNTFAWKGGQHTEIKDNSSIFPYEQSYIWQHE